MSKTQVAGAQQLATYGRGLKMLFTKNYDLAASHPGFGLMTEVRDPADIVDYPIPEALPMMRAWQGDRAVKRFKLGAQTVTSEAYEATLGIPGHHVRLGRMGIYGPRVEDMARRARLSPLYLLGGLLNNAFGTTKAHDGLALCADNHSLGKKSQTLDNKGTAALAGDAFAAARAAMFKFKDEQGAYRYTGMERLALVVPPDLEDTAEQIVLAAVGSSGQTNVRKGKADIIVLPPLSDNPTYWFLAVLDAPPFVHQIQEDIVFESRIDPESDNAWNRDEYEYGCRGRYAVGVGDYRSIWGSTGGA